MSIFENTVLVDKKVSVVNVILRYLCIALAIFCVLVSIIVYPGILLVPAIIFAVFWYLLKIASQIEWEYTYIEGRLSFARIKAKRKRKNIAKIEMEAVSYTHLDVYKRQELDSREKALLRKYQQYVYDTIADFLSEEEKTWLKEQIPA